MNAVNVINYDCGMQNGLIISSSWAGLFQLKSWLNAEKFVRHF